MYKAILVDLDGVILKKSKYFSERLAKKQMIPLEDVLDFFKNVYKQAVIGRADIKKELPKYFKKWHWQKGINKLLAFWFVKEKQIDYRVTGLVGEIRRRKIKVFLVTDNEKHRKAYLIKKLKLNYKFDRCIFSCDLGYTKNQPEFFKKIVSRYKIKPIEIFYWDDDKANIESANKVGIAGELYNYRKFCSWSKSYFDKSSFNR